MLHGPTEAQLKRQIARAISYGGGNLSAFKLVPLQRLDRGMKISRAADKGMQSDICQALCKGAAEVVSVHIPLIRRQHLKATGLLFVLGKGRVSGADPEPFCGARGLSVW